MEKIIELNELQIKEIQDNINERFQFVNHGTYYNVINKKTKRTSNEGHISASLYNPIEYQYLKQIGENNNYFSYKDKSYLYILQNKIVTNLCGFDFNKYWQNKN